MRGVQCAVEYAISLGKVFFLISFAMFFPRFCLLVWQQEIAKPHASKKFLLGIENLDDAFLLSLSPDKKSLNYRVGLITNQTGRDQKGNRTIDILLHKGVQVVKIFTPLHGFDGLVSAGDVLDQSLDEKTKIPVMNLHALLREKNPKQYSFDEIDLFMFDLQDVGLRNYNYVSTLLEVLHLAKEHKKTVVVLDRPNLLGSKMEGSLVVAGNKEGHTHIPMLYGMTVGELARFANKQVLNQAVDLKVVPMKNYERVIKERKKLVAHLSPNIKNIDSCYGYSFLGLLGEVAPFDIGIGTDKAFECLALAESIPFEKQRWYELRDLLRDLGIDSKLTRYFSERKKEYCTGLQVFIADINKVASFKAVIDILAFFHRAGLDLNFSQEFDRVVGTKKIQHVIRGDVPRAHFQDDINSDLHHFFCQARDTFIYTPLPKIMTV